MFHFPQCGHPRAIPRVASPQPSIDHSQYPRPKSRRTRRLQDHWGTTKPPSSENNQPLAEDGSYNPSIRPPNLHNRRPTEDSPNTEDTTPPPYRLTSTIGERTNLSPNTEVRDPAPDHQTSIFGEPTCQSPNTEVTTPLLGLQTSTIGEPHIRRRRRKFGISPRDP